MPKLLQTINMCLILFCIKEIQSMPINNEVISKSNPVLAIEEKTPFSGAIFAKIPQDLSPADAQELFSKTIISQDANFGLGTTNQIARIMFPSINSSENAKENTHYINIPIVAQPFKDYKIVVVTAPKNIKIGQGEDAKPVIIYFIFPEDDEDPKSFKIPSIYFVAKPDVPLHFKKKKEDPIIVVDSNRTVTGLKSKEMTKFVRFKNKMTNKLDIN